MAKFTFRLESYLNLKEKLEDQKKNEYGQATVALEIEKQKKYEIQNSKNCSIISMQEKAADKIDPLDMQRYNHYIDSLKIKEKQQEKLVIVAKNKAEKKRKELVEAMKNRKMLDILKENDYEEYIIEEKKAEQKMVDEIVSYRYNQ